MSDVHCEDVTATESGRAESDGSACPECSADRACCDCPDPFDWFDGTTACPDCGHTCFDHAACREVDGCTCHHPCHFGVLPRETSDG